MCDVQILKSQMCCQSRWSSHQRSDLLTLQRFTLHTCHLLMLASPCPLELRHRLMLFVEEMCLSFTTFKTVSGIEWIDFSVHSLEMSSETPVCWCIGGQSLKYRTFRPQNLVSVFVLILYRNSKQNHRWAFSCSAVFIQALKNTWGDGVLEMLLHNFSLVAGPLTDVFVLPSLFCWGVRLHT